ncbi:MAG: ABC transporter permease [Bacteroidales bacterium]
MFKNYIVTACRNLLRRKGYSFINIAGLAIGIASSIVILLFVQDELSYDRHHDNADNIYRVCMKASMQGNSFHGPITPAPMAATMRDDFPEVRSAVRFFNFDSSPIIRHGDRSYIENGFVWADSTVFDVFTFNVLKGDPATALNRPNTMVLTESAARKYFGDEEPLGKVVEMGSQRTNYEVTGIIQDPPSNSHFSFDVMASFVTHPNSQNQTWFSNNYFTYLLIDEQADVAGLEAKFPAMLEKYMGPQLEMVMGVTLEELHESGEEWGYYLQPLTSIHLHSDLQYEIQANGSMTTVIVFSLIALFILVIASINFMNLSTARSAGRAKEIGLKKVVGSNRSQLINQFIGESVFLSIISLLVALVLVELFMPAFNNIADKQLALGYFKTWYTIPALLFVGFFVGFMSGSYPAFYLASFEPVKVLKGKLQSGMKSTRLRGGLVVFQFIITMVLIISTLTVYRQMNYINNKDMGMDPENVLVIHRAYSIPLEQRETFCQELEGFSGILKTSKAHAIPGTTFSGNAFRREGTASREQHIISNAWVDQDYADVLGLKLIEGRFFSRDFASDSLAVVLNETAVSHMGYADPIGKRVLQTGAGGSQEAPEDIAFTIIGVLKDFHFESLHQTINPMILSPGQWGSYIIVKLQPGVSNTAIGFITDKWDEFVDDQPLEYSFLIDDLTAEYRTEQRTGLIFSIFAVLAIFIACLGLLGLASFTAEQRTKEIGIRKAMGASVGSVMRLLSKEINLLIIISTLIAWPVAWYFMKNWIENFAYRVDIGIVVFVLASVLTYLIALSTVSFQAYRAARLNPVDTLRDE